MGAKSKLFTSKIKILTCVNSYFPFSILRELIHKRNYQIFGSSWARENLDNKFKLSDFYLVSIINFDFKLQPFFRIIPCTKPNYKL